MADREKVNEERLRNFPFWDRLSGEEKELVSSGASVSRFEKNQLINSSDTSCMGMVYVLKGGIRVSLLSDEGREITLFRLREGDFCVTTASCVIRQITFDTMVTADESTELLVIPAPACAYLADSNIYFRAFLYEIETERFSQAIWVIQQMLFKRFDRRLAEYLLEAYGRTGKSELQLTQEEIARDVNSAREVVARMLRQFASDGLVEVRRGRILLKDIPGLKKI